MALFSSSKTSADNKIAAGRFELQLDNTCHYDGMVCGESGKWEEESAGSSTYPELIGKDCACSWAKTADMSNKLFFNFDDVKPGDEGENTVSIHVDNEAWICGEFAKVKNFDNGCTSSEAEADTTCDDPGESQGELQNKLTFNVWIDDGAGGGIACDNIKNGGEKWVAQNVALTNGRWTVYDSSVAKLGTKSICVGMAWNVDINAGNEIQTDSVAGDIIFHAYQARNNTKFLCGGTEPEAGTLVVKKVAQNGDAKFDFTGDNGIAPFSITTSGGNGSSTISNLMAGTYSITEGALPDGWAKTGDTCQSVAVAAGQTSECTITNTYNKVCINSGDVMLVLDRSGSIGTAMTELKTASKSFVDILNPDGGIWMGQSSFATDGTLDTLLTGNKTTIKAGIDALSSLGWTNMYEGLHLAKGELDAHGRPAIADYMILVTDGVPNWPTSPDPVARAFNEAAAAKAAGVTIFVFGIGDEVNPTYLKTIASGEDHYFGVTDYASLELALAQIASCPQP